LWGQNVPFSPLFTFTYVRNPHCHTPFFSSAIAQTP